jgi:hypothetical protein
MKPINLKLNNLEFNPVISKLKAKINLYLNKTNNHLLKSYIQSVFLSISLDTMASKYSKNIYSNKIKK